MNVILAYIKSNVLLEPLIKAFKYQDYDRKSGRLVDYILVHSSPILLLPN